MGSNVDLRIISIAVVISILVGAGTGYMVGNSPIPEYKEEIDQLETINLGIREEKAQLLDENTALQDQLYEFQYALIKSVKAYNDILEEQVLLAKSYRALERSYSELEGEYELLQLSYEELSSNDKEGS